MSAAGVTPGTVGVLQVAVKSAILSANDCQIGRRQIDHFGVTYRARTTAKFETKMVNFTKISPPYFLPTIRSDSRITSCNLYSGTVRVAFLLLNTGCTVGRGLAASRCLSVVGGRVAVLCDRAATMQAGQPYILERTTSAPDTRADTNRPAFIG